MPISHDMNDMVLSLDCPYCSRPIVKKGSWFKVISSFKCAGCGTLVRIGYSDKLALFERHRRTQNNFATVEAEQGREAAESWLRSSTANSQLGNRRYA